MSDKKEPKSKEKLEDKIENNLHEWKHGETLSNGKKFVSKEQALAAAYSQAEKSLMFYIPLEKALADGGGCNGFNGNLPLQAKNKEDVIQAESRFIIPSGNPKEPPEKDASLNAPDGLETLAKDETLKSLLVKVRLINP